MSRKKKNKKRDKNTNLGVLDKKNFKKAAQWKVDYDYLDGLTAKELSWLAKFSKEYYDSSYTEWAGIKKPINKLDAKPRNWRVGPRSNKLCNEQNNAQAADLYNLMFPYGNFHHFDESFALFDGETPEDTLLSTEDAENDDKTPSRG